MAKNKVVTSSMAIALTVCSTTGSFAETSTPKVEETPPKIEVTVDDQTEEDKDKDSTEDKKEENPKEEDTSKEESTTDKEETKPPVNSSEDKEDSSEEETVDFIDNSNAIIKDGFHLFVNHNYGNTSEKFKDIIPTMTFELLDENGKSYGTAVASESNYIKGSGYSLHFKNIPEFKKGDKLRLRLKSADDIVIGALIYYCDSLDKKDLNGDGIPDLNIKNTVIGKNKDVLFCVGTANGEDAKGKMTLEIEGSKSYPYMVTMVTDSDKVGVKVVTEDKKPVANTKFQVERTYNNSKFTATTDKNGVLWLDRTKVQPVLEVTSLDSKYEFEGWDGVAEIILPIRSVEQELDDFLSTTIVLKEAKVLEDDSSSNATLGTITTTMKVNGSTDISKEWTNVELELKDTKSGNVLNYTVDSETKKIENVPDGTYTVTVKSTAAKVEIAKQVTVKNGKGALSLKVSPNHVLEVLKRVDGKTVAYNFSVINAGDKVYKGSKSERFGVAPGETFMVKDNDTEEVFNVTIDSKIGVTKVVLGEGVILSADGTSPHTRDMAPLYVGALGASLLVAGVVAYRMADDKKKALKTLMMTGIIAGSMMSTMPEVFASSHGSTGTNSGTTGGLGSWLNTAGISKGSLVNTHYINNQAVKQVIQFGFIPTRHIIDGAVYTGMSLTEDGTESDLASAYKFTEDALQYAVYMPLNDATKKDFKDSGVLDFNGFSAGYKLIAGYNRLHEKIPTLKNSPKEVDRDKIDKMIVDIPSRSAENTLNYALEVMGGVLTAAETNKYGVLQENIGLSLKNTLTNLSEKNKERFFKAYLELLRNRGVSQDELDALTTEYNQGKMTFAVQTLERVHVGSDKENGMYISVHSLARALGKGHGRENEAVWGDRKVDQHIWSREKRYLDKYPGGYCVGKKCANTSCAAVGHPSYGTWRFNADGYANTLQATTDGGTKENGMKVDPIKPNIFGGWGFFHWKDLNITATPTLTVNAKIDLYNEEGVKIGTKDEKSEIQNVAFNTIIQGENSYSKYFKLTSDIIEYNGKKYKIVKETTNKVELKDVKDNKSLYSPTLDGKTEAKPSKDVALAGGNGNDIKFLLTDILSPHNAADLNTHLGAEKEKTDGNQANNDFDTGTDKDRPTVVDKYEGQVDSNGKKIYSNAEATIYLKAEEVTTSVSVKYEVPQWRLSRYWEDVAEKLAYANYTLTNPGGDEGCKTSSVSPNGYSQLQLQKVDTSASPWLKTEPKWKSSLNYVNVGFDGDANLTTPIGGTLLATKTSKDIDNVNFANWKGAGYTNEINSADKGNTNYKYKNSVTKNSVLKYYMKDPKSYTHNRAVYNHVTESRGSGEDRYYVEVCKCYTTGESMSQTYAPATYKIAMTYLRHHPSAIPTVKLNGEKGLLEAFSWETKQTDTLKLYPEVTMANSDLTGRNNVSIVAGDLHREVTPLSYHFLQLDAEVGSKVIGTSVATDMKAPSLVQNVVNSSGGASVVTGGAQVIHKGSATNTSYTLTGTPKGIKKDKATLTAKTFAVDIGNTALKNSWNPGTTYNTDKVNENYLSQFGTKEGNNWKFTAKFQPALKVGTNEYKGKAETQAITGVPQATKEYSLVVRGGKLTLVSGKNPTTLTQELKDALSRMKINNTSGKTVLDVFEYNKGSKLTEAEVAKLMNALRGTNDLKVGGNWYYEDTTVLVIREYTTIFDLPEAYMYSDKLQMQIPSLETPTDKNQFYTKGLAGHTTLEIGIDKSDVTLKYDSSAGKWSKDNKKEIQYIVPNVSILDTSR